MHCGCGQCSYIHVHCAVDVGHDRVWRSNKSNNYFLVRIIAQNEFILNLFNEMLGIEDQTEYQIKFYQILMEILNGASTMANLNLLKYY